MQFGICQQEEIQEVAVASVNTLVPFLINVASFASVVLLCLKKYLSKCLVPSWPDHSGQR